ARALAGGATAEPLAPIGSMPFYVGSYRRTIEMDFPAPGTYLDAGTLTILGDAFMLYERAEQLGDFFALIRARLARSAGADRSYEFLVLCGLHWWHGERAESLAAL